MVCTKLRSYFNSRNAEIMTNGVFRIHVVPGEGQKVVLACLAAGYVLNKICFMELHKYYSIWYPMVRL